MALKNNLLEFGKYLRRYGLDGARVQLRYFARRLREKRAYRKWITLDRITDSRRAEMLREIEGFSRRPLISVLLPVYDIEEKFLRPCIESVRRQIYENWELCIADDASPSPHIKGILEEYAAADDRIKVVFRSENGHISAASNSALEMACGEFAALLDHDDELSEDALFYIAREVNDFPDTAMIYSDEDLIDERGNRFAPKFKPDWSPDFFYSTNIVTHLSVYKTAIVRKIGGFTVGLEGSQDYDLALRVIEQISENRIRHIPRILYHWRVLKGSVSLSGDEKPYAHERGREAIRQHLARTGKKAAVEATVYNLHRVIYELPADVPKVSLILRADEDTEFTRRSVSDFFEKTAYANLEAVLICPEKSARRYDGLFTGKEKFLIRFIESDGQSSAAADLNSAAAESAGEILCFTDLNLAPLSDEWLTELTRFARQEEIGAVGAKLLDRCETVLHAGLILGTEKLAETAHAFLPREKDGYLTRARLVNNFSAVSSACLATRRDRFRKAGGFDEKNLPQFFFDADYCLRLKAMGCRITFTPYAELIKRDEKRRTQLEAEASAEEREYFARKWAKFIDRDPAYNPNLSKKDGSFSIKI